MADYHKFQECFKKYRKMENTSKGKAYKECVGLNKGIGKVIKGKVFKDAKPKHDLYNLDENNTVQDKIQILLETKDK